METATAPVKKTLSTKRSFTVHKKGEPTAKGNTTLSVVMRQGLIKQFLYLLTDTENVEDINDGDDITSLIPQNFKIRESELVRDEQVTKLKWIELV